MKISNWKTGEIIFEDETSQTIEELAEKIVSKIFSLDNANLVGADLKGADLVGADLVGANLVGANLKKRLPKKMLKKR